MQKIQNNLIVDRYFHQCFKKVDERCNNQIAFFVVRSIALLFVIPVNYIVLNKESQIPMNLFAWFLLVALSYNLLQMFHTIYFYCFKLKNTNQLLKIAVELKHSMNLYQQKGMNNYEGEEDITIYETDQKTGLLVSLSFYDFQNMQKINDVTEQFKTLRETAGQNSIRTAIQKDMYFYRIILLFFNVASVAIFAFGIAVSFASVISQSQHTLLQLFLVTQVLFKPKIYAIMLLISLIPVFLLIFLLYICCKKSKKVILPKPEKVTAQVISKCSQCSICFMSYALQQQVIILPCSRMHAFHSNCISGWTQVKPTCPICRHSLE